MVSENWSKFNSQPWDMMCSATNIEDLRSGKVTENWEKWDGISVLISVSIYLSLESPHPHQDLSSNPAVAITLTNYDDGRKLF